MIKAANKYIFTTDANDATQQSFGLRIFLNANNDITRRLAALLLAVVRFSCYQLYNLAKLQHKVKKNHYQAFNLYDPLKLRSATIHLI